MIVPKLGERWNYENNYIVNITEINCYDGQGHGGKIVWMSMLGNLDNYYHIGSFIWFTQTCWDHTMKKLKNQDKLKG